MRGRGRPATFVICVNALPARGIAGLLRRKRPRGRPWGARPTRSCASWAHERCTDACLGVAAGAAAYQGAGSW
jgi:hypothetical protein